MTPGVSISISSKPSTSWGGIGVLSRIVHDGVFDRRKVKVAERALIEWAPCGLEREREMTGGRRNGLGGKDDIGGGFFGFCLSFGRRKGGCLACLLESGVREFDGSFGAIKASLMGARCASTE